MRGNVTSTSRRLVASLVALLVGASLLVACTNPSTVPPKGPTITNVSARGLGIAVSWAPADVAANVTGYRLVAIAVSGQGAVPGGCSSPPATDVIGSDTFTIMHGVC